MHRNVCIFSFLALSLAALDGCSSAPPAKEAKKSATPDKIVGKAQVLEESGGENTALNAGGSSIYLWQGVQRYRLFLNKQSDVVHGNVYVAEGVYAQKAIDDLGDPDQGKNGYPLQASCRSVVRSVWGALAMDEIDADATVLRARINRYPARPVFLVSKVRPATAEEAATVTVADATTDANVPEVSVAADKQSALLIEGPIVEPAPLWQPEGGTVDCRLTINPQGRVSQLDTGKQLCEAVPWAKFTYKPTVQAGKPVRVDTEVHVKFEARK